MDGTKFLFYYSSIPTFDDADWLWDHIGHLVVYYDGGEVVLISCRHGAKLPSIKVYIGWDKSNSNFARWLTLLKNATKFGHWKESMLLFPVSIFYRHFRKSVSKNF